MRLEAAMWDALHAICRREGRSLHEMCSMINDQRQESSLTAAIRVFIMVYFRSAATDEGHQRAGHGDGTQGPRDEEPAGPV
jgi:predicted DNA-binding ribbon-helix-helix protein